MKCRDAFKCGVSYRLGGGRNIRMWTDIWIDEIPLRTRFAEIFPRIENNQVTVSQCWSNGGWRWRFIGRGLATSVDRGRRQHFDLLRNLLSNHSPTDITDIIEWRWNSDQKFTVKSMYDFITDAGLRDPSSEII